MPRRNPEKALYRVTLSYGGQVEVEANDKRDIVSMIVRGMVIPGRYSGSTGPFDRLVNAAFIVVADKVERKVSPSDESATDE